MNTEVMTTEKREIINPVVFAGLQKTIKIESLIAKHFRVDERDLNTPFSRTKKRDISGARFFMMNFICMHMSRGPSCTGKFVGRGHSDVIHACRTHNNRLETEKQYREINKAIIYDIKEGFVKLPEIV